MCGSNGMSWRSDAVTLKNANDFYGVGLPVFKGDDDGECCVWEMVILFAIDSVDRCAVCLLYLSISISLSFYLPHSLSLFPSVSPQSPYIHLNQLNHE